MLKWLAFVGLVLLLGVALLIFAYRKKQKQIRSLYQVKCNIYLKKGGKKVIIEDIRHNKFTDKVKEEDGTIRLRDYFIVKEAIQDEIHSSLMRVKMFKYLDFDEDIAYPFLMSFVKGEPQKRYLGSERANQMYKQKIWDEIGGLNTGSMDGKTIGIIVVVVIAAIFIYGMMKK